MTSSSITITMILILMAIIVHMHIVMTNGYRYRRRCRLLFPSIIATCMRMKLDANAARTGTVDGHHLRVAPMIRACAYARTLRHNPIHLIDMHQPRWRFVVACAWWCLCWWSMILLIYYCWWWSWNVAVGVKICTFDLSGMMMGMLPIMTVVL